MENIERFKENMIVKNSYQIGLMQLGILVLLALPKISFAVSLFGPSNYEECMVDGKVGRTNAEISLQMRMCRKNFPLLSNISKKGIGIIRCADYSDKSSSVFSIKQNTIVQQGTKLEFKINARNSELIRFEGDGAENGNGKKVKMYGELNISDGNLQVNVIYEGNSKAKINYLWQCIE